MDATEDLRKPDRSGAPSAGRGGAVELIAIVVLGITLVLDTVSRFFAESESLFHVANIVAMIAAVLAIVATAIAAGTYRNAADGNRLHVFADAGAAVFILVSVAMRIAYWTGNLGTPIRAIVPAAIAFILLGVATWASLTERRAAVMDGNTAA